MRLVAYLRVSTNGQANGSSFDIQEAQCRERAEANGHEVVGVRRDAISGTTPPEERVGWLDVMGALHDGDADGVVIMSLDRLARELHIQEACLATAWERDPVCQAELRHCTGWLFTARARSSDSRPDDDDFCTRSGLRG